MVDNIKRISCELREIVNTRDNDFQKGVFTYQAIVKETRHDLNFGISKTFPKNKMAYHLSKTNLSFIDSWMRLVQKEVVTTIISEWSFFMATCLIFPFPYLNTSSSSLHLVLVSAIFIRDCNASPYLGSLSLILCFYMIIFRLKKSRNEGLL